MKKIYVYASLLLSAMFIFTGCSSVDVDDQVSDEMKVFGIEIIRNKTTKSEVLAAIGAPGMVFESSESGDSWVYPRIAVRSTNFGFRAGGNFAALFPYTSGSFSKGGGVAGARASVDTKNSSSTYMTAGLRINFNKQGCVIGYEFSATSF